MTKQELMYDLGRVRNDEEYELLVVNALHSVIGADEIELADMDDDDFCTIYLELRDKIKTYVNSKYGRSNP